MKEIAPLLPMFVALLVFLFFYLVNRRDRRSCPIARDASSTTFLMEIRGEARDNFQKLLKQEDVSMDQLLREALSFYEWYLEAKQRGERLLVKASDGTTQAVDFDNGREPKTRLD